MVQVRKAGHELDLPTLDIGKPEARPEPDGRCSVRICAGIECILAVARTIKNIFSPSTREKSTKC